MDESVLSEFEQLKISAFSKYKFVKCGIDQVTLGPNSLQNQKRKLPLENKTITSNVPKNTKDSHNHEIQNFIQKNESQRVKEVRSNVQNHIDNMEKFSKQNQVYHQKKWLDAQEAFIKSQTQKEQKILEANDEFDKSISIEHARTEKHYQDMEEQRKLREQELKLAEERRKMLHVNIDKIKKNHQEFRLIYQTITMSIQKCVNREKLREKLGNSFDLLKNLPNQIEEIRLKCKDSSITDEDVKRSSEILMSIKNLSIKITQIVDEINEPKEISTPKVVTPVNESTQVIKQPIPISEPKVETRISSSQNKHDASKPDITFTMSKYISVINFKFYCEIISFFENHKKSFQELEQDSSLKQFKFDCKKAVNIPVNALSGVSSEHILDKYNKLCSLLKGQNVEVHNKIVNASKHPQGIAFCTDLLAKKLVLQGDLMVSSNPESAFCYATLIISLWNEIPTFGQLVLAYFYKVCPPLVPYYIPREVGESDEQYYTKLGYQYIDGQIETRNIFLKRITGISRLYFAILIAKSKRGQKQVPHNLSHGWRWLSSILKLEPQVDVTATMVHTFLETVGFEMEARYGKVFLRLLQLIGGKFLLTCKEKCTGGAGTRLELLLNEYNAKRKFLEPPGYTAVSSW